MDEPDWKRAGEALARRMEELGWSQTKLHHRSGVSRDLIRALTSGVERNYQTAQLGDMAKAVGWPANALQEIARGTDPAEIPAQDPDAVSAARGDIEAVSEKLDEVLAMLSEQQREIERLREEVEGR